ncbi:MAG: SseB family protein [Mobilicoccus sp.]|nr:SseB family protein [Mobilicoccus sp.]
MSELDSGGIPFQGRELSDPGFSGDTGASDPRVIEALTRMLATEAAPDVAEALRVLRSARILVPVVATPPGERARHHGEGAHGDDHVDDGHDHDGHEHAGGGTEMATVTLTGKDGSKAMPVFTGVEALATWDPQARPSPNHVPDVARSAIEDGCDTLLVDLGSPHAVALPLSHVWALAQEREWMPPHEDPVVRLAVAEAGQGISGLTSARAEDGATHHGAGVVRLVLTLEAGLTQQRVEAIVAAVGERLAADPEVRIRIDDLAVVLRPADA